jgi:hypothetical protein
LLIGLLQRPGAGAGGDLCRPDAGNTGDAGATGADTAPGPVNISQLELSGTFLTFPSWNYHAFIFLTFPSWSYQVLSFPFLAGTIGHFPDLFHLELSGTFLTFPSWSYRAFS